MTACDTFSVGASWVSAWCTVHRQLWRQLHQSLTERDSVFALNLSTLYHRPTLLSEVRPGLSQYALWCPSKPEQLCWELARGLSTSSTQCHSLLSSNTLMIQTGSVFFPRMQLYMGDFVLGCISGWVMIPKLCIAFIYYEFVHVATLPVAQVSEVCECPAEHLVLSCFSGIL